VSCEKEKEKGKRKCRVDRGLGDEFRDDGRARKRRREISCEKELESRERSVRRVKFR
jgi:hypothetical protein